MADLRKRGRLVVWPTYFDSKKARSEGRRVPKKLAVASPNLGEIAEAAKKLGLNPTMVPEAAYPQFWWEKSGMILVDRNEPKTLTLRRIAEKLLEMRH